MRSKRLVAVAGIILLFGTLLVGARAVADTGTEAIYNWTSSTSSYVGEFKNTGSGYGMRGYTTGANSISLYGESYGSAATGMRGYNDSTGYGVYGRAKNGYGTYGETNSTSSAYAGVYGKATSSAVGVRGFSTAGDGVEGMSSTAYKSGVYGHNDAAFGYGVYGSSTASVGVAGTSQSGFGVVAEGNDTGEVDQYGDIRLLGNFGEILASGNYLGLTSNGDVRVDLDQDNNTPYGTFVIVGGNDLVLWEVYEPTGGVVAAGSQASAVDTAGYGQRLMYAVEGTGVWLEDVGTAALAGGKATVTFDPVYAQAANLGGTYQVFLTVQGEQPVLLSVAAKTASGFTVRGVALDGTPASCAFDYRVVAPRQGYEKVRTEEFKP